MASTKPTDAVKMKLWHCTLCDKQYQSETQYRAHKIQAGHLKKSREKLQKNAEDMKRRLRLLAKTKKNWAIQTVRLTKSTLADMNHRKMYEAQQPKKEQPNKEQPKAVDGMLKIPEKYRHNVGTMGIFVCRKCGNYGVSPSALPLDIQADVSTFVGLCNSCKTLEMIQKIDQ